ncbi:alpha-L-arabinofuranosidase C-terminal domain-containing protein [soil metagenome]
MAGAALAQEPIHVAIRADKTVTPVSPSLYGIFFEEINQAGDGGIYGELLRNRGLENLPSTGFPEGWKRSGAVTVDRNQGLNAAHPASLRLDANGSIAQVVNEGFWGIGLRKGEKVRLVVWAKGSGDLSAALKAGAPPKSAMALGKLGGGWKRYEKTITASETDPKAALTLRLTGGEGWIGYASLMPLATWKKRPNGLRADLAKTVDAMKPAFVRFPGGCFVEGGDRLADRFQWKNTIGPVEERVGIARGMWGYPSTSGLGYHEYLQWCEDMGAAPLFVANVGMSHKEHVPMPEMDSYVQDTLDAIEYANGPVTSKWGAVRSKNGHPKPFGLKYVEIGNENGGPVYSERFALVSKAIGEKYPDIVRIADVWGGTPTSAPYELIDEHYYSSPGWFWRNANRYDGYKRTGPKIYVGEYAVTQGCGQGNLDAALGEAAFMTGMERNSDVVRLSSYAPLFVNVNNRQWNPNAIVFDSARSFGTPSYHVQAMFANNRTDRVVETEVSDVPVGLPPAIEGTVGLMTWRTQVEFKDVELIADGKKVFSKSALTPEDVTVKGGAWIAKDGSFGQTDMGQDRRALLKGIDLTGVKSYALTLKARKLAGDEGFLITLDAPASNGGLQYNFGGWGNTHSGLERGGSQISPDVPLTIDTGRWYDVRIEREGGTTRAFLDGKLVQSFTEVGAPDFATVVGIDDKTHEIVIKAVNGAETARAVQFDIAGMDLRGEGKSFTLTGPSLMAENSFEQPNLIVPKEGRVRGKGPNLAVTLAPRSVTVLRLPLRQ